nr:hypothetical protein CFP56_33593 [Quercus suber]
MYFPPPAQTSLLGKEGEGFCISHRELDMSRPTLDLRSHKLQQSRVIKTQFGRWAYISSPSRVSGKKVAKVEDGDPETCRDAKQFRVDGGASDVWANKGPARCPLITVAFALKSSSDCTYRHSPQHDGEVVPAAAGVDLPLAELLLGRRQRGIAPLPEIVHQLGGDLALQQDVPETGHEQRQSLLVDVAGVAHAGGGQHEEQRGEAGLHRLAHLGRGAAVEEGGGAAQHGAAPGGVGHEVEHQRQRDQVELLGGLGGQRALHEVLLRDPRLLREEWRHALVDGRLGEDGGEGRTRETNRQGADLQHTQFHLLLVHAPGQRFQPLHEHEGGVAAALARLALQRGQLVRLQSAIPRDRLGDLCGVRDVAVRLSLDEAFVQRVVGVDDGVGGLGRDGGCGLGGEWRATSFQTADFGSGGFLSGDLFDHGHVAGCVMGYLREALSMITGASEARGAVRRWDSFPWDLQIRAVQEVHEDVSWIVLGSQCHCKMLNMDESGKHNFHVHLWSDHTKRTNEKSRTLGASVLVQQSRFASVMRSRKAQECCGLLQPGAFPVRQHGHAFWLKRSDRYPKVYATKLNKMRFKCLVRHDYVRCVQLGTDWWIRVQARHTKQPWQIKRAPPDGVRFLFNAGAIDGERPRNSMPVAITLEVTRVPHRH